MAPVTAMEVAKAMGRLNAEKACGPDRLAHEFDRCHASSLIPHISDLFSAIIAHGRAPPSSAKVEVYCIPRVARPSSGLDCRPIALLNGDYKLFTRILASRLRTHLSGMVHETQNGLVPGRDIHDTIDILTAARALVCTGHAPRSLAVLILDFRKAYNSIDRAFLRTTLLHHRLPERFVDMVMVLHDNTTSAFLANELESREVPMRCGIRQWRPLAPLLFILSIDLSFPENGRAPNEDRCRHSV